MKQNTTLVVTPFLPLLSNNREFLCQVPSTPYRVFSFAQQKNVFLSSSLRHHLFFPFAATILHFGQAVPSSPMAATLSLRIRINKIIFFYNPISVKRSVDLPRLCEHPSVVVLLVARVVPRLVQDGAGGVVVDHGGVRGMDVAGKKQQQQRL